MKIERNMSNTNLNLLNAETKGVGLGYRSVNDKVLLYFVTDKRRSV